LSDELYFINFLSYLQVNVLVHVAVSNRPVLHYKWMAFYSFY